MNRISSKNNDMVKKVKKLLCSASCRREYGMFVVEGARLVFDILSSDCEVCAFFITDSEYEKYRESAQRLIELSNASYFISADVSSRLSDTKNPQGVFAVCKAKNQNDIVFKKKQAYIALDNLSDPGNLGNIVRSAEALGISAVIISGGCDLYNPKVLRASMGSALRIPVWRTDDLARFLSDAKANGISLFATVPSGECRDIRNVSFSSGGIAVIGNEANGISQAVLEICENKITIPMPGKAESLNANVAAAIVMWEMMK